MNDNQSSQCFLCQTKLREIEIRIVGVDGTNGLNAKVKQMEKLVEKKLNEIVELTSNRITTLEKRMYFIFGIPGVVLATITILKLFNVLAINQNP